MDAPCTVILVKQTLPFELLGSSAVDSDTAETGYSDSVRNVATL
jgi:hypothetical protein